MSSAGSAPVVEPAAGGPSVPKLVIHAGVPKAATSYVQSVLFANQQALREAGVLVPGTSRREHARIRAAIRAGPGHEGYERWTTLVQLVHASPVPVLLSNEWFTRLTRAHWRALTESAQGVELHLVFTARDLVRQASAAWQEQAKLGVAQPLDAFVEALEDGGNRRWKWAALDVSTALSRLDGIVPADQVSVVTVPPPGAAPTLLWQRFEAAAGIPSGHCDTTSAFSRSSVGVVAAKLLQVAGPALRSAVNAEEHEQAAYTWIQEYLAHTLIAGGHPEPIALRTADAVAIAERSARMARRLEAGGYRIVGSLSDLTSTTDQQPGRHPDEVTTRELLDASIALNAALLQRASQQAPIDR